MEITAPRREEFGYALEIPTRWIDNDVYGHVNNAVYLAFFDTVINSYLIEVGGLDIHHGEVIGLCVESHCEYRAPIAFPQPVDARLRVAALGRSSVRYEVGLFTSEPEPAAFGHFVHVFVARRTRRPQEAPPRLREALAAITEGPPVASTEARGRA
ncbi:MAG: acyl-CoA thioesterase [Conexibacteraceae bacterium]|nr:acyl-CoA thioesterase [Conexibacteraceae bacterium]